MDSKRFSSGLTLGLAMLGCCVAGGGAAAENADPLFTRLDAFLGAHPDLYWRKQGIDNYGLGRYAEAMTDFRRAARYADKTSQAMLAQMLWNGEGVKADRVMAYVWADLAAERHYPAFIATREKFWRELSADEQRAAVAAGQAIFDEYGDAIAKKREDRALRLARLDITGSRTGHVGTVDVHQQVRFMEFNNIDGALYYADKYWKPELYWQWQDRVWTDPPEGKVEVGPIQAPPEH